MKIEEARETLKMILEEYRDAKVFAPRLPALETAIKALKRPEIIRCKDCKHAKSINSRLIQCDLTGRYELHDWYCASARRREEMTREEAIDVLKANYPDSCYELLREAVDMAIEALKQPEPLTYYEQCIFLAAMGREKKLCEELDKNPDSPSKQSLSFICKEIERKVKKSLWRREE